MAEQEPEPNYWIEPHCKAWIETYAPGRTFAEIGGLWGTVNERVTLAIRAGAIKGTMIDLPADSVPEQPGLWQRFHERCRARGITNYEAVEADLNDPQIAVRAGVHEVVYSTGVLYHCPRPLDSLLQVRKLCKDMLILGTATIPDQVTNAAGSLNLEPGSALFIPAMNAAQRAVAAQFLKEAGATVAIGVIDDLPPEGWRLDDYGPWWWFFTRQHVAALLDVAGFDVLEVAGFWYDRATMYLARKREVRGCTARAA
ncbi:MAG: hypothetical protein JO112_23325 [Planctomycetes bacterium]|nr:hypothetical protein [Planctomycetota bacterium]